MDQAQTKNPPTRPPHGQDPACTTRTVLRDGLQIALEMHSYSLTVIEGPCKGREAVVRGRIARIGTDPSCDLHLEQDDTVSSLHCLIEVDGTGYRLRDQDSKNGVTVGGYLVKDIYLKPGTIFQVGSNRVQFVPGEETEEVQFSPRQAFGSLLGQSLLMREVFATLEKVSTSDSTVLIEGESGTGKELAARGIHGESDRRTKPFVVFDLSTIAPNLLETELFGHVKGAFTGALFNHPGAMVAAHNGYLFLDEVGDLSMELQPRLLRAIESRTVRPVGSSREVASDCRIIGATNRALRHLVRKGRFREDLYWRLAVVVIRMPPLRERPEDIPLLINHFLRELGKDPATLRISYQTMNMMQKYPWPGNVRELRNFVERATVMSDGAPISPDFMDHASTAGLWADGAGPDQSPVIPPSCPDSPPTIDSTLLTDNYSVPYKSAKESLLEAFETDYWTGLLRITGGNVSEAARRAGVHRKTVEYTMRKLGIER